MASLLQDLRFALRLLARTPGFTIAAIAVLALGIGVNTAIFSLVDELIWTPRPYPNADRIVQLYSQNKKDPRSFRIFSYPTYRDIAAQSSVFSGVFAHTLAMVAVGDGETSRRTFAALISANYFSTLDVTLAHGRTFLPEEEHPGSNLPVTIASHLYWKKTGFDPALVGKTVRINERLFTVVGITPEHFTGTMMLFGPEFYFPLGVFDTLANDFDAQNQRAGTLQHRDAHNLFLVARLKPGISSDAADAALRTIATNLEAAYPTEEKDQTFLTGPLPRLSTNTNPNSEHQLTVLGSLLLAMSGVVLLIACLNLANMLLARGGARRKEIAIRLALGSGRSRIVRQLLTEGFVLAGGGGIAGFFLGNWSTGLLVHSVAGMMPVALFFRGASNPALFAAVLAFCTLATLFFALGPALKLTRADVITDLKQQAGEDAPKRRRLRWLPRHPLVVVQMALSLTLLTVAGLFIRGALKAGSVATGFNASTTVLVETDASLARYDQTHALQLYQQINDRLAALPGVEASSIGSVVPFGMISMNHTVRRAGLALAADARPNTSGEGRGYDAQWTSTGADYFRAMGLPILRGRAFTSAEANSGGAPRVAVIDEALARDLFPDRNPLGERIEIVERDPASAKVDKSMEVIGIVPTTHWNLPSKERSSALYVPFAQGYQSNAYFHVRFATLPEGREQATYDLIRREIQTVAPSLPLFAVKSFPQHLDSSMQLWLTRAGAALFGLFGGLALVLAIVGLYGVKAYAVSRRTREIGIRMALGAEPRAVRRMILLEGLAMTATGLVLGLVLGLAAGQACASMLYEVDPTDPAAFLLAAAALSLSAILACWLPALRATKVSPLTALRAE